MSKRASPSLLLQVVQLHLCYGIYVNLNFTSDTPSNITYCTPQPGDSENIFEEYLDFPTEVSGDFDVAV